MAFTEQPAASRERPAVIMTIPRGRAITGSGENRKEGFNENEVVNIPFPGDILPSNPEAAKFFLDHIAYCVNEKKYGYHGHVAMDGSVLAAALEKQYGKGDPLPGDAVKPVVKAKKGE
jgi:CobQ-like glutamine amidotransferase family enzyme